MNQRARLAVTGGDWRRLRELLGSCRKTAGRVWVDLLVTLGVLLVCCCLVAVQPGPGFADSGIWVSGWPAETLRDRINGCHSITFCESIASGIAETQTRVAEYTKLLVLTAHITAASAPPS